MQSENGFRWTGPLLIVGGGLMALGALLHPDEAADPAAVATGAWVLAHTVYVLALLALLLGLAGVYAHHAGRRAWLGLAGYTLSLAGIAQFLVIVALEAWVVPVLAADPAGEALLGAVLGGPLSTLFPIAQASSAAGLILFGASIARERLLPRVPGFALAVAAVPFVYTPPVPYLAGTAAAIVIALSFVWLGYRILAGGAQAVQPAAAAA
jgi:hypothetical protein